VRVVRLLRAVVTWTLENGLGYDEGMVGMARGGCTMKDNDGVGERSAPPRRNGVEVVLFVVAGSLQSRTLYIIINRRRTR
jgi:hypothetical protein